MCLGYSQLTSSAIEVSNAKDVDGAALRGIKRTAKAGSLTLDVGGCSCRSDGSNGKDACDDLHDEMIGQVFERVVGW